MSDKEALEKELQDELQDEVEYLLVRAREFAVFVSTVDAKTGMGTDRNGLCTSVMEKARGFRHCFFKYEEAKERIEDELSELRAAAWRQEKQKPPRKKHCWRIVGELVVCAFIGAAVVFSLLGWAYGCGESYVDAQGKTHIIKCPKATGIKEIFNVR